MLDLHNTDLTMMAAVEKGRPERLENAIRRQRYLREIQPKRVGLLDRILAWIGSALIAIGTRLKKRSVLVLTHSPSVNQPDC
jgi:hypothetical protein